MVSPMASIQRLARLKSLLAAHVLGGAFVAGCTFHSTATHWHERTGIDGQPVFLTTTTTYGFNLLVLLPFVGDTRTDALIEASTAEIAVHGSDRLRVVETEGANYWYALPPISWFVTPVMGSVSIEFTPSAQALAAARAATAFRDQRAAERNERDNSHILPEPRR